MAPTMLFTGAAKSRSTRGVYVLGTSTSRMRPAPCSTTASRRVVPPWIWCRTDATAAPRAEIGTSTTHALEETQVGATTDPGDDLAHAELASEQRHEQIPLVVVDDRHQDIAVADVLALEQFEIGPVAVEHERPPKPRGERLAPGLIPFDERDIELG